jgi:hypothetical protein
MDVLWSGSFCDFDSQVLPTTCGVRQHLGDGQVNLDDRAKRPPGLNIGSSLSLTGLYGVHILCG